MLEGIDKMLIHSSLSLSLSPNSIDFICDSDRILCVLFL